MAEVAAASSSPAALENPEVQAMAELAAASSSTPDGEDQEPEEVYTNQTEFLQAISPGFLSLVYPVECGLLDEMRSGNMVSSEEEEHISAGETRRERARRCWKVLHKVPPGLFEQRCYAVLKDKCSLALQGKSFAWDGQDNNMISCIRHLVPKRISLRRFADIFPATGSCTFEEYRRITEGSDLDDSLWNQVFQVCRRNKDNAAFTAQLTSTLQRIQVPVPDNFRVLLARGFPCCCSSHSPAAELSNRQIAATDSDKEFRRPKRPAVEADLPLLYPKRTLTPKDVLSVVKQHVLNTSPRSSSCGYPSTMATDYECRSSSIFSSDPKEDAAMEEEEQDQDQEACFQTHEQKERLLEQMELIDDGIVKASNVKTLFRELTGVHEELTILKQNTLLETDHTTLWHNNLGKFTRLQQRVRVIKNKLDSDFSEAERLRGQTEEMRTDTELPFTFKKSVLTRKQVLDNELKEAAAFYKQARARYAEMQNLVSLGT